MTDLAMVGADGTKSGFVAAAGNRMTVNKNQSLSGEKKSVNEHDEKSLCLMAWGDWQTRKRGRNLQQAEERRTYDARWKNVGSCQDSRPEPEGQLVQKDGQHIARWVEVQVTCRHFGGVNK
ncbi:hypothetical protein C8J57DRAFT_1465867 [Mycena rebaudengoi]|nr:hypothetical protein C8J57DRAFT_1465867 [Mycena rebaudengoi]